ncbi:mannitol dehydrogenase family protein [Spongiibacter sp. KMU-158]|uniref:Mannitol dehydrogenase family protein n=1 Tax=Spongiibacter pelagi TaxID=2760804 RepID=A0A927GWG2_9GAMM|nr:mannitol dehydrogenase family protein [Spongiibacter pelagi]MBD2859415.1 mannitol dehydrogenase family protein [Spongiibacter pelagi]
MSNTKMRLSAQTAASLKTPLPEYFKQRPQAGIVHLGLGAFHRAHQAWYTHKVLEQFGGDWRIIGVSLRSSNAREQLQTQDNLYTLEVRDGNSTQREIIGAISEVIVAPESPERVIQTIASATTHVVTLTITEKGYCLSSASGELDLSHPEIQNDLQQPNSPLTALGFLAAALAQRKMQNRSGLTILSCDNIAANGKKLRAALLKFCQQLDPALADWVDENCRFPCSMVDRIVPASSETDIHQLKRDCAYEDRAAVFTEPFSQWVIEQNFAGAVPAWDKVGAEYVSDVAPFEAMKLRLLNASHSAIAYMGAVMAYQTVDEFIANATLRQFIAELMHEEAAPTLSLPASFDLAAYEQQLLQRFANSALRHRCQQIAMDGSQKIPNRLLPILRWQLNNNKQSWRTSAAIAAWLRYLMGKDETGNAYPINDPMSARFSEVYEKAAGDSSAIVTSMLSLQEIFPIELHNNARVVAEITDWLNAFRQQGILAALEAKN